MRASSESGGHLEQQPLGFDKASPGLMTLRPTPRGEPVLNGKVMVTAGLAMPRPQGRNSAAVI
jgi:hypothetical protein